MHLTMNLMFMLLSHIAGNARNVCNGKRALVELETRMDYVLNPTNTVSVVFSHSAS